MENLFLLIPILVFGTVALLAVAIVAPSETTVQARLRDYGYDLSRRPGGDLRKSFAERLLLPLGRGFARVVIMKLTPIGIIASSRERLRQARQPMSLAAFLALRMALGAVIVILFVLPKLRTGNVQLVDLGIAAFAAYVGYRLPDIWLSLKIDARREKITRALPDALDLIVVCVEAGHGLEQAIAKVVDVSKGPLAEEFAQTLAEIGLGRSRRDALRDLAERCASPDLQTFIAALLQADQMGVSIAEALRIQAGAMRVRRRQRAEELIAKAPVKMLIPMIFLIFPALFAVILGPAGIKIMAMLGQWSGRS